MKELVITYALSFIGTPYKWAGNNPLTGWDCSGFIQEVLKAHDLLDGYDNSAQMIFEYMAKNGSSSSMERGAILFFGKDINNITHVALSLGNNVMLECGGGDASTTSLERAKEQGAFVRIRTIASRSDFVTAIMPNYSGG